MSNWMDGKEKKQNIYFMKAKYEVDDEFYTSYHEIQAEIQDYKKHFKNKIVVCPCNDGEKSNFYKFFSINFKKLELKKLITTTFNLKNENERGAKIEIEYLGNELITKTTTLQGRGDFRSQEVKEIIASGDIVITNPPFSLFRDLIKIVIEYNKQFMIVGGTYSITYKSIYELYTQNKIWLGNRQVTLFTRPNGTKKRFSNISWFTNMKSNKHLTSIKLVKKYKGNEHKYPQYDNYEIIEVQSYREIPIDYDGAIGVPLTFFLRHNPSQFKILCCDYEIKDKYPQLVKNCDNKTKSALLNGKELFTRIIIQRKNGLMPRLKLRNQI